MRNTNNISTVKHFLENHVNAIKSENKRKENVKSMNRWTMRLRYCLTGWYEWKCNPFDPENQNLWTLQTCAYASEELVNDFESVYEDGDALLHGSINNQFQSPSHYLIHTQRTIGKHSWTLNCLILIRNIHKKRWKLQLWLQPLTCL